MNTTLDLFPFPLRHHRLRQRAARIVQAALDHPGASIPQAAGSRAATDATYRFFDNPNVPPEDLDAGHRLYTVRLSADLPGPLLIAQDTTDAEFTSPARNQRLGELAHPKHFGFFIHSALAISADGLPLGLLHQHVWTRDPAQHGKRSQRRHKPTADKESQRWLDTEQACVDALPTQREVVTIADREADFYDYFALARRPGQHVLIRAKLRRRIADSKELLGVTVRQGPVRGTLTITVPRHDDQPSRQATLTVRYGTFSLLPPCTHLRRKELPALPLQAVWVEESDRPTGVKPLRWLLLSTLPVSSLDEAARLVRWYSYRWRIERYHFTLKSGCRLEELQLETLERLRRALALYAVVAARLLHLTYRARTQPDEVCTVALDAVEWEVLWRHFQPGVPLPAVPPSLHEALRWVARLGGFLNRQGDGEPGVKVLWRGLRALADMVRGFQLATAASHSVQSSDE